MNTATHTIQIRTPEGVVFSLLLASPISRFLAWSIDLAVIGVLQMLVGAVLRVLAVLSWDVANAFVVIGYFCISIGYSMVAEWYARGQTVGKRVLRLRVVDEQGLRLQPGQIIVRNLLRFLDILPSFYFVGGLACVFSRRSQRLGDIAAGTIVIREPHIEEPDIDQIKASKFNSLRRFPILEARLRQVVTPEQAALALKAVLRRDQLEDEPRVELFRELAAYFRSLVPFPPEVTENLSDEHYVRNVVEVIYTRPER